MLEFVFGLLIRVVVGLILLPTWLVLASPVIWVVALFGPGSYSENFRRGYGKAIDVWASIMNDM
jgi:hypothetical protein